MISMAALAIGGIITGFTRSLKSEVNIIEYCIDWMAEVFRSCPFSGHLIKTGFINVISSHAVMASRREIQRLSIHGDKRPVFVSGAVNFRPEIHRVTPG